MRKNFFLDQLLYRQGVKKTANFFLNQPWLIRSPFYQLLLKRRIKKVIKRYEKAPFSLRIENTNACNARCYMCPHSTMKRKQGFMEKELYQKIIDQAVDLGIDFINLHNFGEPLLDKDFVWRVRYAKEKGIAHLSTNSNGQAMGKRLARQLIDSGLDEIFFSLDAAYKRTYQKIRIGLDFKKVNNNIKHLLQLRRKLGLNKPRVIVDFLQSDLNEKETGAFIKKWQDLADQVCISQIHDWSAKKKEVVGFDYPNYVSFSQAPCRLPFTELLINWDGTVSLCCQDTEGELIVGDARKQSLEEIWQGKRLKAIRKKHLALKTNSLPLCRDCKLRTFWWLF